MKRVVFGVLTALLIITMTLVAMYALVGATIRLDQLTNPVVRLIAVAAEIVLGIVLLLGTIYLATHLAVRIFAPHHSGKT
jgi:hypothetical protein